jgi:hypothetical protein
MPAHQAIVTQALSQGLVDVDYGVSSLREDGVVIQRRQANPHVASAASVTAMGK